MNKFKICLLLFGFLIIAQAQAQETESQEVTSPKDSVDTAVTDTIPKKEPPLSSDLFRATKTYILGGISVKGNQQFSDQSITVFSELEVGQPIKIPGDKLTSAIKKLWNSKLFSNVDVYVTKLDGETIYLEFEVNELTKLTSVEWRGIKKNKAADLQKETDFKRGARITEK